AGDYVPWVATGIAVLLLAVTVATNLGSLLAVDKLEALESVGRVYTTMSIAASVGLVTGYACRNRMAMILCLLILVFDMYVGFRFLMAISTIAIIVIEFQRRGALSLIRDAGRTLILILFVGQFFFVYQNIKAPLKAGDFAEVQRRFSDPAWYVANFATSEPFITQSILNEVIRTDFTAPNDHLTSSVYNIIVFAPELGATPVTFNDYFQPTLYRNVRSGVASNMWAQFWSVGGVLGVIFAATAFAGLLALFSHLVRRSEGALLGGVSLVGACLAFYIQRNELSTLLILEKRMVMVLAACVIGAWCLRLLQWRIPPPAETTMTTGDAGSS
ncbi:MAG: hypothetical protein AAFU65_15285, partial [Pseudomonadota bacterium]